MATPLTHVLYTVPGFARPGEGEERGVTGRPRRAGEPKESAHRSQGSASRASARQRPAVGDGFGDPFPPEAFAPRGSVRLRPRGVLRRFLLIRRKAGRTRRGPDPKPEQILNGFFDDAKNETTWGEDVLAAPGKAGFEVVRNARAAGVPRRSARMRSRGVSRGSRACDADARATGIPRPNPKGGLS